MLRGIYTSASGMLTATRDINNRANNLANVSTAGFKQDRLIGGTFGEAVAIRQEIRTIGEKEKIGEVVRGRRAVETWTDFSQGSLEFTQRDLDMAIADGPEQSAFFMVQSTRFPEDSDYEYDGTDGGPYGGVYYTRNGQFQVDEEGLLINGRGDRVLDDAGGTIEVISDNFVVDDGGRIFSADNEYIATLGIYVPDDPHLLIKNGEDVFSILNEDNLPGELPFTGAIKQRYIERANTNIAENMAGLITSSRSYQTMSQILKAIDGVLGRSISDIARV